MKLFEEGKGDCERTVEESCHFLGWRKVDMGVVLRHAQWPWQLGS